MSSISPGRFPNASWLILAMIAFTVFYGLLNSDPDSRKVSDTKEPQWERQVIQIPSGITPAAGMPLAEDQALEFHPHGMTRDGVPFYAWTDGLGRHVDVFVMRDPTTGDPRLFSFPADRVGGSEGPKEPPVVTGGGSSDTRQK